MAKSGEQYVTIGPNRSVDGDAVPSLDNAFEGASQDYVAGAFLTDDGAGNLIEVLRTVTSVTLTNAGSGYTSAPTVTATVRGAMVSVTITNAGSNYMVAPAITFSGSGGGAATATVDHSGKVTQIIVTTPGVYSAVPTVTITPATNPDGTTGSGAAATAVVDGLSATAPTFTARLNGGIGAFTVTAGGTGYTLAPFVKISAPDIAAIGRQATAIATVAAGAVTAITAVDAGAGYTAAPTVTLVGGGGTGATATVVLTGSVVYDIVVATPGSKLTVAPSLGFSGGGGTGAAATAVIGLPASIVAVAAENAHNDAVAATHRALVHTIRGYKDEFSGTFNTTNLVKGTTRYTEVGLARDPVSKKHYIASSGTGIVVDGFDAAGFTQWDDGDSYPVCNFHVRQSLLKLA